MELLLHASLGDFLSVEVINLVLLMLFQSALLALAAHASNPVEADRLRYLASPAGKVVIFKKRKKKEKKEKDTFLLL